MMSQVTLLSIDTSKSLENKGAEHDFSVKSEPKAGQFTAVMQQQIKQTEQSKSGNGQQTAKDDAGKQALIEPSIKPTLEQAAENNTEQSVIIDIATDTEVKNGDVTSENGDSEDNKLSLKGDISGSITTKSKVIDNLSTIENEHPNINGLDERLTDENNVSAHDFISMLSASEQFLSENKSFITANNNSELSESVSTIVTVDKLNTDVDSEGDLNTEKYTDGALEKNQVSAGVNNALGSKGNEQQNVILAEYLKQNSKVSKSLDKKSVDALTDTNSNGIVNEQSAKQNIKDTIEKIGELKSKQTAEQDIEQKITVDNKWYNNAEPINVLSDKSGAVVKPNKQSQENIVAAVQETNNDSEKNKAITGSAPIIPPVVIPQSLASNDKVMREKTVEQAGVNNTSVESNKTEPVTTVQIKSIQQPTLAEKANQTELSNAEIKHIASLENSEVKPGADEEIKVEQQSINLNEKDIAKQRDEKSSATNTLIQHQIPTSANRVIEENAISREANTTITSEISHQRQLNDQHNQIKNHQVVLNEAINIQRKDFVDGMKEKVMVMINQKIQQADIRLDPPELGNVHVRVNLQNEVAAVSFVVQNQQAKEAFEQQMGKLREMLGEAGVDVGDANVAQQQHNGGENEAGQNSSGGTQGQPDFFSGSDNEAIGPSLVKASALGVDFYA